MTKYFIGALIALWAVPYCLLNAASQSPDEAQEHIQHWFEQIAVATDDKTKLAFNDSIDACLTEVLTQEDSFYFPFDSLQYLGKIMSSDRLVRIYTWNISLSYGFLFNGFVQRQSGEIYRLTQTEHAFLPDSLQQIAANQWYGALYYRAVAHKYEGETVYLLAGWSRYRAFTQVKILDVIRFDGEGNLYLGLPIFRDEDTFLSRICFEYDALTTFHLDYNASKKRFEADHLSPIRFDGKEILTFGADMSVDAFVRKGKYWIKKDDIKVKNVR
ncbi:MAG: hypothetical protein LBS16_07140 [Prevotellaceae bacterium]|jgi:hypothetical protein|nr:hypothetical protein [Prevotellaceae bacterium]